MNSQSPDALITDLWIILRHTVASFVYNRFSRAYPDNFSQMMEKHLEANQNAIIAKRENPLVFENREHFAKGMDIHGVLQLIDRGWSDTFEEYPDSMREDALFLSQNRHAWAHQKERTIEDVQEVAQIAERLLNKMKTRSAKNAIKKIRQLLRHDYYGYIRLAEHYIERPDVIEASRYFFRGL